MRLPVSSAVLLATVLALPTASGADTGSPSATASAARPRGTFVQREPSDRTPRLGPGPRHRIIYMNRHGGTFHGGYDDDSSTNASSIPSSSNATVSAWSYGDARWTQLMSCTRLMFARFDVAVTDVDPGSTTHIESVVGGYPGEVDMPDGVGGVAPMNYDCSVVERAIVYTFSGVYGDDVQEICHTVAQETAHALGLDHEYKCEDPMTYLYGCGDKTFLDVNAPCGEDSPRECMCGGNTQNSVQAMFQILGSADDAGPEVDIVTPRNGDTVAPGFRLEADASDAQGVTKVDFYIDSAYVITASVPPYRINAPHTLTAGAHTLEARAYDLAGNEVRASISVSIETPTGCVSSADCGAGERCESGACLSDSVPGSTGSPCIGGDDCANGTCGSDGVDSLCTESCVDDASCPDAMVCRGASSGAGLCWPGESVAGFDDGAYLLGGCSISARAVDGDEHGARGPFALLALVGAVLIGARRRQRGQ